MGACCSPMPRDARLRPGAVELRLQTNAAFAANLALYAKVGYAIDRTEPFRGGAAVQMSKRIDAHPVG